MEQVIAYLTKTTTLVEVAVVIASFLFAFITKKILSNTVFKAKADQTMTSTLGRGFEVVAPVFRPLLTIVFISLVQAFLSEYISDSQRIITVGYEIAVLWGIVRLISFSTESRAIVIITMLIGLVFIATSVSGNLVPFIEYLDRFSFKIGSYQFSIVSIVKGLLAISILIWLAGILTKLVRFVISRFTKMRNSNRELLAKGSQIVIYFALFLVALDIMGIDLTALAVFSGAVGVGLGFGLQKITSNFISGLILLLEKTVEVNDVVELDNGLYGHVREIGARYTMIETLDTKEVMVPNEEFISSKVTNWTYSNPTGRMEIPIGVGYDSDLKLVQKVVVEALKDHPRILRKPEPQCLLDEFGDSSVNFRLLFWIDDVSYKYFSVKSDVMMLVWDVLKLNEVEIPFPQRDLNLRSVAPELLEFLNERNAKKTTKKKTTQKSSKTTS